MKDFFLSLFWAAICAFAATWLLIQANAKWEWSSMWIFPAVIDFLHQYNIPVKAFIFCSLLFTFLVTGLHKLIGNGVRILIGIAGFLLLVVVVLFVGFYFISWLISML